jgi:hypothetical protein
VCGLEFVKLSVSAYWNSLIRKEFYKLLNAGLYCSGVDAKKRRHSLPEIQGPKFYLRKSNFRQLLNQ